MQTIQNIYWVDSEKNVLQTDRQTMDRWTELTLDHVFQKFKTKMFLNYLAWLQAM